MVVGRHYGPFRGITVRLAGLKKPFGGSWRVIDRYRRAANPDVVRSKCRYKLTYVDLVFAK
jgi:hypothetical protein